MNYLNRTIHADGSYPAPQSTPAPDLIPLTDEQAAMVVRYSGFVVIEEETDGSGAISCKVTPNLEAWEAWKAAQPDPMDGLRAAKEAELSAECNAAIEAGMDVETSRGTEHFSLQETDQINLTTAYNAILSGASDYPYHADGALCRMFTAAEITAISNASIAHKLYHTTLCNHLLTWARRAESEEELNSITYTAEGLPDDLAANMAQVLAAAQNV
jgi:hypothetical protein